jgi:hypothetical protein
MTEKCELAVLLRLLSLLNLRHPVPFCLLELSDSCYFVPCRPLSKAATRSDYYSCLLCLPLPLSAYITANPVGRRSLKLHTWNI